jgi:hypothetical protein
VCKYLQVILAFLQSPGLLGAEAVLPRADAVQQLGENLGGVHARGRRRQQALHRDVLDTSDVAGVYSYRWKSCKKPPDEDTSSTSRRGRRTRLRRRDGGDGWTRLSGGVDTRAREVERSRGVTPLAVLATVEC